MRKFTIQLVLLTLLLLLAAIVKLLMVNPAIAFAGGSGTPEDPYIIIDVYQLQAMKDNPSAYYALGADIDASDTINWNGGRGFEPVGSLTSPFSGGFDGRGYKIYNLFINRQTEDRVGLFGVVDNWVVIKNLRMENASIAAYSRAGIIAGILRGNALLENCFSDGQVSTVTDYAGGLVGGSNGSLLKCGSSANVRGRNYVGGLAGAIVGSVIDSSFTGDVTGENSVGGIAGYSGNEISTSWAAAENVNGKNYVGGLVGYAYSSSFIIDSYSLSKVSGTQYVGGLVGYNLGYVINTYSAGPVVGTSNVGGLIGANFWKVLNSFWDIENSGQSSSSGGTGKTTENMMNVRTFTDNTWSDGLLWPWDFVGNPYEDTRFRDRWKIDSGYPFLVSPVFSGTGSGTIDDPFLIENVEQLDEVRDFRFSHFALANNIDATQTMGWNGWFGFFPIGPITSFGLGFSGSFNGNGHTIENLFENWDWDLGSVGLFSVLDNSAKIFDVVLLNLTVQTKGGNAGGLAGTNRGFVERCRIFGGTISGSGSNVGGVVGRNLGTIKQTTFFGTVSGSMEVGGLVGWNDNQAWIIGSGATVQISGNSYVGGLIGRNYFGNVFQSFSSGNITQATYYAGGLIGANLGSCEQSFSNANVSGVQGVGGLVGVNYGMVLNCYASGSVTGSLYVGGLAGSNEVSGALSGKIRNSYSVGPVAGNTFVGGLVGLNNGEVTNSFWDNETSGQSSSAGGTGKTTENMKNVRTYTDNTWSDGLTIPWDFLGNPYEDIENYDIWDIHSTVNSGYPFLVSLWREYSPGPPPTKPNLYLPENNAAMNNSTPDFEWENGIYAERHRLVIDDNFDFSSPVFSLEIIGDNKYTLPPENALPDGQYYWKVIAVNMWGENESDVWNFIVDTIPPSAPVLILPENGENINDNTPELTWQLIPENTFPVTYTIAVGVWNKTFSLIVSYDYVTYSSSGTASIEVSMQLPDNLYCWFVYATDGAGNTGEWSQIRFFRVDTVPPEGPTLVFPVNGENTNDNTPTLVWNNVFENSLPIVYTIEVDNENTFSAPLVFTTTVENWSTTGTSSVTTSVLPDGVYYWRVRARDNAGNEGDWSGVWSFRIDTVAPYVVGITISDNLITESDNGGTLVITITYSENMDASVAPDIAFDPDIVSSGTLTPVSGAWISPTIYVATYDIADVDEEVLGVDIVVENARDLAGNTQVPYRALDMIDVDTYVRIPILISPVDGENINDDTPTLLWENVVDASLPVEYYAAVSDNSAFPYENASSGWITDNNWTTPNLSDGVWYWRVRARDNAGNEGGWSGVWSFRVDTIPPAAPTLVSPSDGENTND
ncbi:MAG: GLUG motif-containing protein, partial [Candidatus Hadarchaeales archaeon]